MKTGRGETTLAAQRTHATTLGRTSAFFVLFIYLPLPTPTHTTLFDLLPCPRPRCEAPAVCFQLAGGQNEGTGQGPRSEGGCRAEQARQQGPLASRLPPKPGSQRDPGRGQRGPRDSREPEPTADEREGQKGRCLRVCEALVLTLDNQGVSPSQGWSRPGRGDISHAKHPAQNSALPLGEEGFRATRTQNTEGVKGSQSK